MSDVLHHARPTPTQQGAVGQRMRFLADINARAAEVSRPKVVEVIQQEPLAAETPECSPDFIRKRIMQLDKEIERLHSMLPGGRQAPPIDLIIEVVATARGVAPDEITMHRKTAHIVRARQIVAYLARTLTKVSTTFIARRLGHADHTSVLHSVQRIEALCLGDRNTRDQIESLKSAVLKANSERLAIVAPLVVRLV
jgi:hypothetical protein